jgi:hypothetical protein
MFKRIISLLLLLLTYQVMYAQTGVVGDNLGSHIAIKPLNMNNNYIRNFKVDAGSTSNTSLLLYDGSNLVSYLYSSFYSDNFGSIAHLNQTETFTGLKTFNLATTFNGASKFNGVDTFVQDIFVNGLNIGAGQGNYNTVVGKNALYNNLCINAVGFYNTAIGCQSLYNNLGSANSNGSYNTAIGYQALYGNIGDGTNVSSFNTAIGYFAGKNNTSGQKNTFIGYNSGYDIITGSNNTIIGNPGIGKVTDVSNNIILADGAGNIKFQIDDSYNTTVFGKLNLTPAASTPSNISAGKATLVSGSAIVSTTAVTANSIILLTRQAPSGSTTLDELSVGTITVGTSFIINSNTTPGTPDSKDNSIIGWLIIN